MIKSKFNSLKKLLIKKEHILEYILTSPEHMSKKYYRDAFGKELDLKNPRTFNEKLQWLKIYYCPRNKNVIQCADKYRVREYLSERGFGEYLNELYFNWEKVDEIDWDALPESFVIKCNHGCGFNIICPDKKKLNIKKSKKTLKKWMKIKFGHVLAEPHYDKIKPHIICEKFLGGDIVNYNIYCFNGTPVFFSVIQGLGAGNEEKALTYYYADNSKAEFCSRAYPTSNKPLPECIEKMKKIATEISKEFPMVRVDFFEVEGKIYFSELTFTPGSTRIPFEPACYDEKIGELLDISYLLNQ